MALVYRMHAEADIPALVGLWAEHSGWDRLDAEAWGRRLIHTPFGPAAIALASDADSGRIVGQFAFIPSLIWVEGREVPAFRPFAPILSKEARGWQSDNPLDHPIAAMYRHGIETLGANGLGLVYMLPDPRWARGLRVLPFLQFGSFPLWSRPLPLSAPDVLGRGATAAPALPQGEAVDRLWSQAVRWHGCGVVRDSRGLPWKIGGGDYHVLGVRQDGELIGLVASRHKGDRQWLICDLLAADTGAALRSTLAAACNVAHKNARDTPPDQPISKVAILATPVMQPALAELGFARDTYDFPLVVQVLDPSLDPAAVAPERWYVSAND